MAELDEVSDGFRRLVGPLVRAAGLKGLKMAVAMSCYADGESSDRVVTDLLTTGNMDPKSLLVSGALLCNVCVGSNQNIEKI